MRDRTETLTREWIILTMGDRPRSLSSAIDSIRAADPESTITVVENGNQAQGKTTAADRTVTLPENVGVPAGRNVGIAASESDLIAFLDDDATVDPRFRADRLTEVFENDPHLAVTSFAIKDPISTDVAKRHIPRIGSRNPDKRGTVTSFLGGACCMKRSAVQSTGGYWDVLFYGHEETDLAWRMQDRGWKISYEPEFVVRHPADPGTTRSRDYWKREMRNRVLIARRNLPGLVRTVYMMNWLLISGFRALRSGKFRATVAGFRKGLSIPLDEQRSITWNTIWLLTKRGRPPIV